MDHVWRWVMAAGGFGCLLWAGTLAQAGARPSGDVIPVSQHAPAASCEVAMTAAPGDGAVLHLQLIAPCHPDHEFTLYHYGIRAVTRTDGSGRATIDLPALTDPAVVMASFEDGAGAVVTADVDGLAQYQRFVVQTHGEADSLRLTVLGCCAGPESAVGTHSRAMPHALNPRETRLGGDGAGATYRAVIYSVPAEVMARVGPLDWRLEADVTAGNCGRDLEVQGISTSMTALGLQMRDLRLPMPGCESVGTVFDLGNPFDATSHALN